jgi:hypothetical protein
MANNGKYLTVNAGVIEESTGVNTSAGAGDAGKIAKLDASGRWDPSMMPVGVAADTASITTSEALSAGDWVNVWNSTGVKVRKADATTAGKEADGFVLSAFGSGATALVYFEGTNTAVSSRTVGAKQWLGTTAGAGVETALTGSGNVVQQLGKAISATSVSFEPQQPITLA